MIILLDCDGVLGDFVTPALRVVDRLTGKQYLHDDVTDWDLGLLVPERMRDVFWNELAGPGFTCAMKPYPGAQDAVARMRESHEVYVVTAHMKNARTWVYDRDAWLAEHFGFTADHIVHTKAKQLVRGDLFVDDNPGNVAKWSAANPRGRGFLYDRPYNRDANAARVHGWGDVLDELAEWLEEQRGVVG